jgi:hypothetical protein
VEYRSCKIATPISFNPAHGQATTAPSVSSRPPPHNHNQNNQDYQNVQDK